MARNSSEDIGYISAAISAFMEEVRAMKKVNEVIQYFEDLYSCGAIYLWGSNGQIITKELCDSLYQKYGSKTYTKEYYDNKFLEGAGKIGADCSGAMCPMSGFDTTAQKYYDKCSIKGSINFLDKKLPCLVFKGKTPAEINHIGFYCGNGYVIEMQSSKTNCVKSKLETGNWNYFGVPLWIDYSSDPVYGIDISSIQGNVDFTAVKKAGYKFVILRTVIKDGTIDKKFKDNYAGAKAAGLKLGVYTLSYSRTEMDAIMSAQKIIAALNGDKIPIFLDLEKDGQQLDAIGKDGINRIAKAFQQTCDQYGYPFYIYCNLDWYKNVLDSIMKPYAVWIARYGKNNGSYNNTDKPNIGEKIWQFTSKAKVPGINKDVDKNICYDMSIFGITPKITVTPKPSYKIENINVIGIVTSNGLRIRTEPNTDSQIVGSLSKGDIIPLTGKVSNDWYRTDKGYVSGQYIKYLQGEVVNCNKVNVRQMPDKSSQSLRIAYPGDTFLILKGLNDWYNVLFSDDLTGWIKKDYVAFIS